jgi:hypothetical protein
VTPCNNRATTKTAGNMAAYFFASPLDIDIKFEGEESRKQVEIKGEKDRATSCPVYYDGDAVGGVVCQTVTRLIPVCSEFW